MYQRNNYVPFSSLAGQTLAAITTNEGNDEIRLLTTSGDIYLLRHDQDCCESVSIESIVGDLSDLIGTPILKAEEVTSEDKQPGQGYAESFTWTFYKLATIRGYVDIRWFGESNGYYSEAVDCVLLPRSEEKAA